MAVQGRRSHCDRPTTRPNAGSTCSSAWQRHSNAASCAKGPSHPPRAVPRPNRDGAVRLGWVAPPDEYPLQRGWDGPSAPPQWGPLEYDFWSQ